MPLTMAYLFANRTANCSTGGFLPFDPTSLRLKSPRPYFNQKSYNPIIELHGRQLPNLPDCRSNQPGAGNLEWHVKNVFRDGYSVVTGIDH